LTDLQSKNGAFVNEKKVTTHFLEDGDVITIGKHTLVFEYVKVESKPEEDSPSMHETMVIDTVEHRAMLNKKSSNSPEGSNKPEEIGALHYLSGGHGDVDLVKKLTKIGKDVSSDIVVGGLTIGKTSFTISKRPKGYHLSYVSGLAKPKVNNQAIKTSVQLNEFDMIEIGSLKVQFIYKN